MNKNQQDADKKSQFPFLLKALFVICAIIGAVSLFGTIVGTAIPFIISAVFAAIPFLVIVALGYLAYKLLFGNRKK